MPRLQPYAKKIVTYPPTWWAIVIVLVLEAAVLSWFQPGPLVIATVAFLGIACLVVWVVILLRSKVFLSAASRRAFEARLAGSSSEFGPVALDCWRAAERIKQEFNAKGFSDDVDAALANLVKLTDNHVKLYSLCERFGDDEQKREMHRRIEKQVEHVETTRNGLLRLGGNIVLLEANAMNQDEIGAELRTINAGLEDAIREMDDLDS